MPDSVSFDNTGNRYDVVVPDTLDLADRATLAINGIGGSIDPDLHYHMYFSITFCCKTPYMSHHGSADSTCDTKFGESFPMMRTMCGSTRHADIEAAQRAELLSRVQEGLYWDYYSPERPWRNLYAPKFYGKGKDEDFAVVGATGRLLRAMVGWRELAGSDALDGTMREMIAGMRRVAVFRDDLCYYPDGGWGEPCTYPRSGWLKTDEPQSETEGAEGSITAYHGNQIYGASKWYALSGDPDALDLAARLARFCMQPKFWGGLPDPDGKTEGLVGHVAARLPEPAYMSGHEQGHWYSHFHARALALRGILEYGLVAQDERALEFVRRSYEFTLTQGIPRIGWINCWPARSNLCEGCALGDLVAMGIRLSDAGLGDYWDDVDAVVRNHLVEQQLTQPDLLRRTSELSPERVIDPSNPPFPRQELAEDVIARSIGTFNGASLPDCLPSPWVMQCCTGNGTQGLYYAWEGTVRENGDTAQVNLLLNRAARLLDVDSYLPYEGKVVIRNKSARRVSVRMPFWAPRREVRAEVSGTWRPTTWVGNYVLFDDLKPADTLVLQFPIQETTAQYTVNAATPKEQAYACTFRGSTLVDISPRDNGATTYPMYLRGHMRAERAPMKAAQRFVADRTIVSW